MYKIIEEFIEWKNKNVKKIKKINEYQGFYKIYKGLYLDKDENYYYFINLQNKKIDLLDKEINFKSFMFIKKSKLIFIIWSALFHSGFIINYKDKNILITDSFVMDINTGKFIKEDDAKIILLYRLNFYKMTKSERKNMKTNLNYYLKDVPHNVIFKKIMNYYYGFLKVNDQYSIIFNKHEFRKIKNDQVEILKSLDANLEKGIVDFNNKNIVVFPIKHGGLIMDIKTNKKIKIYLFYKKYLTIDRLIVEKTEDINKFYIRFLSTFYCCDYQKHIVETIFVDTKKMKVSSTSENSYLRIEMI